MIRSFPFTLLAQASPGGVAGSGAPGLETTIEPPGEQLFEFARFRQFDDERVLVVLLIGAGLAILSYVWFVYRRDSVELRPGIGPLLFVLRLAAFAGLFLFFLQPEMRTDHNIVRHSRVVLLADVSQSMGLSDIDTDDDSSGTSRSGQVIAALSDRSFLDALRAKNDVIVSRFDEKVEQVVTLPKLPGNDETSSGRAAAQVDSEEGDSEPGRDLPVDTDWSEEMMPRGAETRIGESIRDTMRAVSGAPIAGVILLTDGAQNAGALPESAIQIAIDSEIPIYTVGIGSPDIRRNARISEFAVPARVYPGDAMTATVYLQSTGFEGRFVDVTLQRRDVLEPDAPWTNVASERAALGPDGQTVAVPFEVTDDSTGRRTYQAQITALDGDTIPSDDERTVDVEIVDRKLRVLLMASGATREYRFLRNQLRRDDDFEVDVLLQSSPPGISQDASEILHRFPVSKDSLYAYDCIVAFDADWMALDAQQIAMVESWVSEEAGGLVLIAGPIHSTTWLESGEHAKLRDLFPVVFRRGLSLLADDRFGSETPYPLLFTREGAQAEFLQLSDAGAGNTWDWGEFRGVHGQLDVKGPKPGATVYATLSGSGGQFQVGDPVYMAGQFYGSGRVFYSGSGEMWRLRAAGEGLFEVFYTKLLRQVTQGRLLRGEGRGVLLVERDDYLLGDTVVVQARLKNERHEPLDARSVELHVTAPDGAIRSERLAAIPDRTGGFIGQFRVFREGAYGLNISDAAGSSQVISKRIQVRLPDLERQHSELNEKLLSQIASRTDGLYYGSLKTAIYGDGNMRPLAEKIRNREEIETVRGAPDRDFEKRIMTWLLCGICGVLCLEWLIRRVSRLA